MCSLARARLDIFVSQLEAALHEEERQRHYPQDGPSVREPRLRQGGQSTVPNLHQAQHSGTDNKITSLTPKIVAVAKYVIKHLLMKFSMKSLICLST